MTREEEFKKELRTLIGKYGVDISLEHIGSGEFVIEFYARSKWDANGDKIRGGVDFQCKYFDRE